LDFIFFIFLFYLSKKNCFLRVKKKMTVEIGVIFLKCHQLIEIIAKWIIGV
jgi:hypothetical protein